MPLIHRSLQYRGNIVLIEARQNDKQAAAGNYATVAAKLLQKFPTIDAKNTYNCNDNLNFHLLCSKGVFYLCLADKSVKLRIAYSFLGEVEKEFLNNLLFFKIFRAHSDLKFSGPTRICSKLTPPNNSENPKSILIFSIDTFKPGRLKLNRCLYTTTMMSRVVVRFPQTAIGMFGLKRETKVTSAQLLVTYLSLFPCLTSASSPETV